MFRLIALSRKDEYTIVTLQNEMAEESLKACDTLLPLA